MNVNKDKKRPNMSECLDVFLLPGKCVCDIMKKAKVCPPSAAAEKRRMFMGERGCSISEAARKSGVEAYVLRYWEEEGLLKVPRNAKGHRCYTEEEFAMIRSIQEMKKEGMSLKDIRNVNKHPEKEAAVKEHPMEELPVKEQAMCLSEKKQDTLQETKRENDEKKQQFYVILERLVKEISLTRNREARYRRLDEAIRRQQESRKLTAATQEKTANGKKNKRGTKTM